MIHITESKKHYIGSINKVMDYIDQNLDQDLNLGILAKIANFSPFHFHRMFTLIAGETINQFIKRVRIEKAASLLLTEKSSNLTEIAFKCGYSSLSVFSRAFKEAYKLSASEFRKNPDQKISKICKTNSKNGKLIMSTSKYLSIELLTKKRIIMDAKIEVKEMPELQMMYVRHTGAFNLIGQAYEKLFKWAGPRGLLNFPETKTATVYHDDPTVTDIENLRQSACITVANDIKPEGEVGKLIVPKGKYVVGRFEIGVMEFEKAWNSICLWLTESGWQPSEGFPYELYYNNHEEHPEKKFILDICIPVKPI